MRLILTGCLVTAGLAAWFIQVPSSAIPQAADHPLPAGGRRYEPQRIPAVEQIRVYIDGFLLSDGRARDARYYLSQIGEGLWHGVIVDRHDARGRILGVEYLISAERHAALPEDEKRLWHPHRHAVESGLWVMPGADPEVERTVMQELRTTWGKAWLCWADGEVPRGEPKAVDCPIEDGQVPPDLIRERDARAGTTTERRPLPAK